MRRTRSIGSSASDATARTVAPPVSKRQRIMMDQFESMSLQHNPNGRLALSTSANVAQHHDYPSSVAAATAAEEQMTDDDTSMSSSGDEKQVLSAEQEAQRNIVYQLALGKTPAGSRQDTVDRKLEEMIRRSRLQLPQQQQKARDDFDVHTPYTRASSMQQDFPSTTARQRSNSLPQDWQQYEDVDMMML